jgi:hypothetical protein
MTTELERLIDAAEKHAESYDGDDRQDIKTDVMNAFYAGAKWQSENLEQEPVADWKKAEYESEYMESFNVGKLFAELEFADKAKAIETAALMKAADKCREIATGLNKKINEGLRVGMADIVAFYCADAIQRLIIELEKK